MRTTQKTPLPLLLYLQHRNGSLTTAARVCVVMYCCRLYLATGCLPRICLRGNVFTEPLPSNGSTCHNIVRIVHALLIFKITLRKWSNFMAGDSRCYQQSEKCDISCAQFLTTMAVPSHHIEACGLLQENDSKGETNSWRLLFLCWEKSNHIYNRNGSTDCHEERWSISKRSRCFPTVGWENRVERMRH
jgi:hypothetical protein